MRAALDLLSGAAFAGAVVNLAPVAPDLSAAGLLLAASLALLAIRKGEWE